MPKSNVQRQRDFMARRRALLPLRRIVLEVATAQGKPVPFDYAAAQEAEAEAIRQGLQNLQRRAEALNANLCRRVEEEGFSELQSVLESKAVRFKIPIF